MLTKSRIIKSKTIKSAKQMAVKVAIRKAIKKAKSKIEVKLPVIKPVKKPNPMTVKDVLSFIRKNKLQCASVAGHSKNGTRIHVWYAAFGESTPQANKEAKVAEELGIDRQHYTGKLDRIWNSDDGDLMLTMLVELERDHKYRSFNVNKGEVYKIAVLGK